MRLKQLTDAAHPMYREALELYKMSFPPHEQREKSSQDAILKDEEYHFCLLYDEDVFVGLVLYWEREEFLYIEHLCILPEKRNKQYGQKALALLAEQGNPLILEIDPPKDEISKRRKGFYERCGFVENAYPHIHPPYHEGNKGHELVLMTYPGQVPQEVFAAFTAYLRDTVMKNVFRKK